ncbi:hypothetical protein AGMMS4957_08550 [Bacteroidia bacterium]|nr:hypothetical protein AGMMS4957_08550 [Bacteroidia bacterium]
MTRSVYMASFLAIATLTATAQPKHEIALHGSWGLSTLQYTATVGSSKAGTGFNFGAGYTYFFNDTWGISTGLGAASFNSRYTLAAFADAYQTQDAEHESFRYDYSFSGYAEEQRATLLQIPLMAHFEAGKYYAAFGGKIGIPVGTNYTNDLRQLQAKGYFEDRNVWLDQPQYMGFGTFERLHSTGNLKLNTALFVSVEAGMKWELPKTGMHLYTGVYLDYSLFGINRPTGTPIIEYNAAAAGNYCPNSVLMSTASVNPLSVAVKIAVAYDFNSSTNLPAWLHF